VSTKHRDDLYLTIRDAIRLQAAEMTQRTRQPQYIADGQAVFANSDWIASTVTDRILKHYRVSRSARSERVVKP